MQELSSSEKHQAVTRFVQELLLSGKRGSFSTEFSTERGLTAVGVTLQIACSVDLPNRLRLEELLKLAAEDLEENWGQVRAHSSLHLATPPSDQSPETTDSRSPESVDEFVRRHMV